MMEKVAEICREWLRSCSCAPDDEPWKCEACTDAFRSALIAALSHPEADEYKVGGTSSED